jgi:hypothetical protein
MTSPTLSNLAKAAILLFAVMVMPLFLSAQTKSKTTTAPAPAAAAKPAQPAGKPGAAPTKPGAAPTKPGAANTMTQPNRGGTGAKGPTTNAPPKPVGTKLLANGGKSVTTPAGHTLEYNKSGHLEKVTTKSGAEAHFDSRGKVSTIKTANGTVITHTPGGGRQMVTEHTDANGHVSRIVGTGPNRGYAEHTFQRGGHEYMRRTYVNGGRTYVNVYRGYYYHGYPYYYYVPAYYYGPAYYGWAYNPWAAPVYYNWGWYGSPWYGPYGYYFAPYQAYPSAAFWLTDYMVAADLRSAYEAGAAAGAANNADAGNANNAQASNGAQAGQPAQNTAVTLTPEVKQMIAEEVKAQLAAEQAAAGQSRAANAPANSAPQQPAANTEQVPPALDPNLRVFIVATSLDVTSHGQTCSLSAGDVLMRSEDSPDKDNAVGVSVVSSKKSDCSMGSAQRVQVADLQDMHNHFREQLSSGLKTLADNQGKNGIPAGPAAGGKANAEGTAAPDLTVAADLERQNQEADEAEKEVQQASAASTGSAGGQQ